MGNEIWSTYKDEYCKIQTFYTLGITVMVNQAFKIVYVIKMARAIE